MGEEMVMRFMSLFAVVLLVTLSGCAAQRADDFQRLYAAPSTIDRSFDAVRLDHGMTSWQYALDDAAPLPKPQQLAAVNDYVNGFKTTYLSLTHWASPREMEGFGAVCHDYALAKYELLHELGWREADMRIAVLRDTTARASDDWHAVLVVRSSGHFYVLDNMFEAEVVADRWPAQKLALVGQPLNKGGAVDTLIMADTK